MRLREDASFLFPASLAMTSSYQARREIGPESPPIYTYVPYSHVQ